MGNAILEANDLGQSVWLDNIRRGMLRSGELERLISMGVSGITSNPTIFEKAILGGSDYDDALLLCAEEGMDPEETYEALAIEDIRAAADLLRAHYDRTDGADGYVSLEVNPPSRPRHGGDHQRGEPPVRSARPPQRHDEGAGDVAGRARRA